MVAWLYPDVQHFVSKCKHSQNNWPCLGKTVSACPDAGVWERLHIDWTFVRDQGNIFVIADAGSDRIEDFLAGKRTSETVKVYLTQIFARFRNTKTFNI